MFRIRDISIRNKLVCIQFFTCMIVLVLCCAIFVVNDVNSYKENKAQSLSSIAEIIGSSSISSLDFIDNAAANKILSDLRVETDINNAIIFDKSGNVFSYYTKKVRMLTVFLSLWQKEKKMKLKESIFLYIIRSRIRVKILG